MPHFMVDDGMPFHAKIVAAGNAAVGLWTRAGAWSQQPQNLTEGFIPTQIARTLGTAAQIRRLVAVELWHEAPGGYQFHEWLGRQMSRAEILERRQRRTEASRRGGIQSGKSRRSKREVLTSREVPNGPGDNRKLVTSERAHGDTENSDISSLHPPPSAETRSDTELGLEVRANSNEVPVPVLYSSGDVGGERYESNARNSRNGPPKYHPGHDDGYVEGCPECRTTGDVYEAWLTDLVQNPPPPPLQPCGRHHPPDQACRACGAARQERERRAAAQAKPTRSQAIADCHDRHLAAGVPPRCDDAGWLIPPPELAEAHHLDELRPFHCDHHLGGSLPSEWRALMPLTHYPQETAHA